MGQELWSSRGLAWRLFLRDFTGRYKQTFTGLAGAVIAPVVSVLTFLLLNKGGVLDVGDVGVPYPVFAFVSLTVWNLFSAGVTTSTNAVVSNTSFVTKISFAREVLVLAALGETLVELLIRILLVVVVFAIYQVVPAWTIVLAPLAMVPLLLLTLGIGFITAIGYALVRDVGKAVAMLLTFLLFMTPVLYAAPDNQLFATIARVNILTSLVGVPRDLILYGTVADPMHYLWSSLISVAVFFFGWRFFHLSEVRLAERMGAR
jgi:lipopolysaccharide transport system permease protein